MFFMTIQCNVDSDDSTNKTHSVLHIYLPLLALICIGCLCFGLSNSSNPPTENTLITQTIETAKDVNTNIHLSGVKITQSNICKILPINNEYILWFSILVIFLSLMVIIFLCYLSENKHLSKKHESDNKVRMKRIERNGEIMRTIIKNKYNENNKFLTEMYEKECNIESDTDGFKDVKKLIKNKVDKVIKEQKKIKKVIDKKTNEVLDKQEDIKTTIKKNTDDIKTMQNEIKGTIKAEINNKTNEIIKEQKDIKKNTEDIKSEQEKIKEKIKEDIDEKTNKIMTKQEEIEKTINGYTEDIKTMQNEIKGMIKETDKNIKNKQFTNNFKIKVPCYCITETLKSILEALKKRREKDTTNEQSNN